MTGNLSALAVFAPLTFVTAKIGFVREESACSRNEIEFSFSANLSLVAKERAQKIARTED